ncbi:MAG TPA: type IV toxin-antitoxin system AbiEi family antitoxin domain-containing protein [Solirubrobacter sp.]|nr:type IV toxin-antitoxin system AbiEi family antitoxin domain-containing protein [Solirubrobacter sp.]
MAALAARQWSVVDLDELQACGLSRQAVTKRVSAGRLYPQYRGVYALGHPNLSLNGQFLAAVKACGPDAVLSHFSAAVLHRLLTWDDRYPEVTTPTPRRHPKIRTHRSNNIERTYRDGIPVTPPARTLVDLSSMLPFTTLRRAVNEALNQRMITPAQLATANHRGARNLRRVLATAAPTRNDFEDIVLALLEGLPQPEVNQPLTIDGRTYYPDYRWADHRLILEADSNQFHGHLLARADDAARQAVLEAHGERVLRVTWHQATQHPQRTAARVRAALEATLSSRT